MSEKVRKVVDSSWIHICVSLFIFVFVFFTTLDSSLNKYGGTYLHNPDTAGYLKPALDPWTSQRLPGYGLFLYPFLEPHRAKLEIAINNARKLPGEEVFRVGKRLPEFINAEGLQGVFDNIVLSQRLLLSLGAAFLVYACSLYFNAIVVGACFLLGIQIAPLVNPAWLISESVAQPLAFFSIGLLLLYFKKRKVLFLFLAILCSSYLYLVRASGLCMIGLCGMVWIYFLYKERFSHIYKYFLAATGFLPALAYIAYISITSGYLIFGTHHIVSDVQFSCYFLQKEDIENMPTLRSREYARIYLDKVEAWKEEHGKRFWPDFEDWPRTKSFGYRYNVSVWPLASGPVRHVLAELANNPQIGPLSLKERVKLGRELKKGVLKRHMGDRISTVGCNILAGLGYYSDFRVSALGQYGFSLTIAGLSAWCLALLLCPRVRFCLFLPGSLHLLHVVAIAYGNFVLSRYINLTETLFVFAIFLSLWALLGRLAQFCRKKWGERGEEAATTFG